jgi:hypothetical protein
MEELERMWKEAVLAVFNVKFTIPAFGWRNKDNDDKFPLKQPDL